MAWKIPNMWKDGECWIIGGGPSIPREFGIPEDVITSVSLKEAPLSTYSPFLSAIHGKHVIAVNAAFHLGRWVDIMTFGDTHFYYANHVELLKFPNLRVGINPSVTNDRPQVYNVKQVLRDNNHLFGISRHKNKVSWNLNTGAASIDLAVKLGAKRIILLGFDMCRSPNGQEHWHAHYRVALNPRLEQQLPFKKHLDAFGPIANDAKRMGIDILNVSKRSAITQFPIVELKDVL